MSLQTMLRTFQFNRCAPSLWRQFLPAQQIIAIINGLWTSYCWSH